MYYMRLTRLINVVCYDSSYKYVTGIVLSTYGYGNLNT